MPRACMRARLRIRPKGRRPERVGDQVRLYECLLLPLNIPRSRNAV